MEQIVYGDILFIVNFSMDFLALYITAKILRYKPGVAALVLSSGLGAVYAVAALFFSASNFLDAVINLAFAVLMCFIVYGFSSPAVLIRDTLILYAISFLLGGAMTGIYSMVNSGLIGRGIVINGSPATLYSGISPLAFVLIAGASVLFSFICGKLLKAKAETRCVEVAVTLDGRQVSFSGLVDSGNLLCEPAGGLPVIICRYEALLKLFPKGVVPLFRDANISLLEFADTSFARKVRIIPMSGIGSSGIIIGFIPDEVKINGIKKDACIACDTGENDFGGTGACVPSSVV